MLKINSRESDGVTILDLEGKIILGEESSSLRDRIKQLLAGGKNAILLNMANVSFIDSAGVGTLVAAFSSTKSQGGVLKLASLTKKFRETLQVTRLLTVFETYDSEKDALASFQK